MDFVFNRHSGVPVRKQLTTQLEMKILAGAIAPGERLPSVRAMARRLALHPNTVSAAYRDLHAAGHVEMQRGSGVYARRRGAERVEDARTLDEMIRVALALAWRRGFSGREVRQAVERWLAVAPPDHVLVIDRHPAMAELLAHELREGLGVPAECCSIAQASADPRRLNGAVAITLAWHMAEVQRLAPTTAVEMVTLEMSDDERAALTSLPAGSIVLVVSHSPTVLPYAAKLISSLRGDELLVEAHELRERAAWRRLVPAADLVIADALAVSDVRAARPRRLREVRLVRREALERLGPLLRAAARLPAPASPPAGGGRPPGATSATRRPARSKAS
jgi:DNA-binding transcriptional regulator YhcF (GntR family)